MFLGEENLFSLHTIAILGIDELSDEINVDRAKEAAEKARQALSAPGVNAEEVRKELDRAQNRIRIAQMKS